MTQKCSITGIDFLTMNLSGCVGYMFPPHLLKACTMTAYTTLYVIETQFLF